MTILRVLAGAALVAVMASAARAADEPGQAAHVVPAHFLGMPVLVHGGPPLADSDQMPAYVTGVLNPRAGFHDHHRLQGSKQVLPAHQITLTRMPPRDRPAKAIGYWVIPGPKATESNLRTQANPPDSWLDVPLATAIRVGDEWLKLDNHAVIDYGIARGLLALRYFSQGGAMGVSWMQPPPQPLQVATTTVPAVALPPVLPEPPPPVMPADADVGRRQAQGCSGCHGPDGISVNDQWPNLAGQRAAYLRKQLRAYRSGERRDPIMNAFAAPLSDADIDQISEYFSKLPAAGSAAPR